MEPGQVWFKQRQNDKRSRFFAIKNSHNSGFHIIMMAKNSLWEKAFLEVNSIKGFENNNKLLIDSEISKYVLLGELNPIIL